jgi:hypothetical protein
LVRIHEDVEAIVLRYTQDLYGVGNKVFIVNSWAAMFESFPGKNIPQSIVTPSFQLPEMLVSFFLGEGSVDEGNVVSVEEVSWFMGGLVRMSWELGSRVYINSSKGDLAAVGVS